uniref:Protein kinase domain-containing protein n=1 Tax=Anopheles christyi TaxID=43041 RepID=A0A182JX14_9DIPT
CRTEDSGNDVQQERLAKSSKRAKQLQNVNCCTTSKKQHAFRRCRPGDWYSSTKSSHLKPYNAFTPLSEQRQQISIIVSGPNTLCNSFEANQSFPGIGRRCIRYGGPLNRATFVSKINSRVLLSWDSMANMDRVRVDGSNGVRFTAFRPKGGCFPHGVSSPYNNSYIASTSESIGRLPKSDINPNKAVFTIDSKTSRILIVNRNACELLGYNSKELCEMEFTGLLLNKNKMHVSALAEGQLNSEDGTVIILSGKVVELCTKYDKNVAVSLWVRQIDTEGQRCLAVAEPVERRVAQLVIDQNGYIISGDIEALMLFQLDSVDKFGGMDVALLIPAIQLPDPDISLIAKHIRKQKATGKTQDGVSFPLCLMISHHETGTDTTDSGVSNPNALHYLLTIWVYTNLSGLLVIDDSSVIESCNHHFSMLMFGIPQNKTIGEHITKLIPNFGQETDCLTRSRNATLSSLDNDESETETDHVEIENNKDDLFSKDYANLSENDLLTPVNENSLCMNLLNAKTVSINETKSPLYTSEDINVALLKDNTPSSAPPHKRHSAGGINDIIRQMGSSAKRMSYVDGKYRGEAIHYDGNVIDIIYTISSQMLPCDRKVYCIWISRDPESSYNNMEEANVTLTFNSITSTIDNSFGQPSKNTNAATAAVTVSQSRPNSVSLVSQCEEEQVFGEYNKHYTTIKQIGKGAYGYVKLSYRNTDRMLVISKFILKEKLCSNFMITTEDRKEIPMEIYLLTHVKHPNIVTVFDVFENEKFFQLVMEVHGSGMDLFEFIDRRPAMTEKLGCYIFRQIANAVDYLHSLNILHRDIKDENIIIDHNFHVKLIDFGSATFMQEGKLFSTFYGTTEYCSPEVLAGNKYAGPELEMWSLGVTLYVLMFFENPFLDIEETLKSELIIPQEISPELEYVLLALLDKNPKTRITMKQLISIEWLAQEINPCAFNFAHIVPCEPYEVNPEKYFNGQIYSSQTGLSTSPHSLSLVDDEDEGDDEEDEPHAHIDDSFVDPEDLHEDEICPLTHDDEKTPERSYELCSVRETNAAGTPLAKGIKNLSLQEPLTCNNYNSTLDPITAVAGVIGTGNSNPCFAFSEHSVPVVVSCCGGGTESSIVCAGVTSGSGNIETRAQSISTATSSSSPIVCVSDCMYQPSMSDCSNVERIVPLGVKDGVNFVKAESTTIVNTPSLLPLHKINSDEKARQSYRLSDRQSLCDSSCSTTPSLALPISSVLMCTMMPYSMLNSGDSCCSSGTTMSSCCSFEEHHLHYNYPDDSTASSSAADTPTNCCSLELPETQICTKSVIPKKRSPYDDATSNLLLVDARHYAASSSSTSPCSSLTSSKSENNIFDGNFATFSSIYDVVSMDSVTDAANVTAPELSVMLPFHGCAIADLSRPPPPTLPAGLHDLNVSEIAPGHPVKIVNGKKGRTQMQHQSGHHTMEQGDSITAIDDVQTSTNRTKCMDGNDHMMNNELVMPSSVLHQMKLEEADDDEKDLLSDTDYDNDAFEEDIDDR